MCIKSIVKLKHGQVFFTGIIDLKDLLFFHFKSNNICYCIRQSFLYNLNGLEIEKNVVTLKNIMHYDVSVQKSGYVFHKRKYEAIYLKMVKKLGKHLVLSVLELEEQLRAKLHGGGGVVCFFGQLCLGFPDLNAAAAGSIILKIRRNPFAPQIMGWGGGAPTSPYNVLRQPHLEHIMTVIPSRCTTVARSFLPRHPSRCCHLLIQYESWVQ